MEYNFTFVEAFSVVWDDVADNVYQHATPLQALTYAVSEITPAELNGTAEDSEKVWEAYLVIRDHHGICRRCNLPFNGDAPRGGHAIGCSLAC